MTFLNNSVILFQFQFSNHLKYYYNFFSFLRHRLYSPMYGKFRAFGVMGDTNGAYFLSPALFSVEQAEHFRRFMTGDNLLNGVRIISKSSPRTASFDSSSSTACSRGHAVPLDALRHPSNQIFIAVTSTSRSGNGPFVFSDREK